jgi:uncharacterized cofD-like protein
MRKRNFSYLKWFRPGLGIKRWLLLLLAGVTILSLGGAQIIVEIYRDEPLPDLMYILLLRPLPVWLRVLIAVGLGLALIGVGLYGLNRSILAPYRAKQAESVVDVIYSYTQHKRGPKVVAIGGGTGLPIVLRGMKQHTSNLTAIVTVADNGGSSGRLRRDLGILPPGDLRNNIAALADDEDLMTQLFQYRFSMGDLDGHSFGNLFLTALSDITGSMEHALLETERVLAVQGNVLPATLDDITLMGEVWHPDAPGLRAISGEAEITEAKGIIERVSLNPPNARPCPRSVQAILAADLIVIGPGSLYTSILPTLLITGIVEAIRASHARCIYVCNVATQPGETDGFGVADHVQALERHVGPNLFQVIAANNHFPAENAGPQTHYVLPAPEGHEITRRYQIIYADLTDFQYPWRHDSVKLARVLQECYTHYQADLAQEIA